MKLSSRLEAVLAVELSYPSMDSLIAEEKRNELLGVLTEAAALAKRYEQAPVGECMEVGNLVDCDGNRFVGAIIESSIPELRKGQPLVYHRVRIMREES